MLLWTSSMITIYYVATCTKAKQNQKYVSDPQCKA